MADKVADTGPNQLQNFSQLTSRMFSGGWVTIAGTLNNRPRKTCTIPFFSSPSNDASHFGEGEFFLWQKKVTTNRKGNGPFVVTATNNATGDTSEFSPVLNLVS